MTHETILTVDNVIIVNLDENGHPKPHGKTKVEYVEERLAKAAKKEEASSAAKQ